MKKTWLINIFLLFPLTTSLAQEHIEMKGTSIIGNKELPKVLYIVPWKQAETVSLTTPPYRSVLEEKPALVERSAFQRQVRYHQTLYPDPTAIATE
jgi:hypothetical protein